MGIFHKEPPEFNPQDPKLKAPAPHETAAVLRLQRNGWPGPEIAKLLSLRGTQLMRAMQNAMDAEGLAGRIGAPIHDARAPKGYK